VRRAVLFHIARRHINREELCADAALAQRRYVRVTVVLAFPDVVAVDGAAGNVVVGVDEERGIVDALDLGVRHFAVLGKQGDFKDKQPDYEKAAHALTIAQARYDEEVMSELNDSRSVAELLDAAVQGDDDDEAAWNAVMSLQLRATPEVLETAKKYCRSADAKARARGLDVLGQLGAGKLDSERPYFGDCVSMAIEALKDTEPLVVRSAADALSHLHGNEAISALIGVKHHQDWYL